jgi:hypothetical protein
MEGKADLVHRYAEAVPHVALSDAILRLRISAERDGKEGNDKQAESHSELRHDRWFGHEDIWVCSRWGEGDRYKTQFSDSIP